MDFYRPLDEAYPLTQGDLLYPIPFTAFRLSEVHIRDDDSTKLVDLSNGEHATGDLVAGFETHWGILLNQSCDLEEHSNAPLLIAQIVARSAIYKVKDDKLQDCDDFIRNRFSNAGQTPSRFYLPAQVENDFPKSIALLYRVQNFSTLDRKRIRDLRKLSLSDSALNALQEKLAYTFGRFAAPSHLFYDDAEWQFKQAKMSSKPEIQEETTQAVQKPLHIKKQSIVEKIKSGFRNWQERN